MARSRLPGFLLAVVMTTVLVCLSVNAVYAVRNSVATRGLKQTGTEAPTAAPGASNENESMNNQGVPSPGIISVSNDVDVNADVTITSDETCVNTTAMVGSQDIWTSNYSCTPLMVDAVMHTPDGDVDATPFTQAPGGQIKRFALAQAGDMYEVVTW